ncbi:MAG: VCBS domain-containing protein, partial [Sedimenticola sp.]
LVATDADATDTPTFIAQTGTGSAYGSFDVTTGGVWTYTLDNVAAQSLAGGQSVTETFTVVATTADGESANQTVTVTITGTEDAPVITGTASGAVVEDTTLTTGGTLSVTDADAADSPTFTAQTGTSSTYGSFDVTTGGVWTYNLDNVAAQSLAGGQSVTETFTVVATTADGESASQVVTVTITGTEDAPVITGTATGAVVEDTTLTTGGTLSVTDADAADSPTFTAQTGTPSTYGTFSVTTGGVWSYNLDNVAAQSLAGGQSVTETFTVVATTADGESTSQVVTVTITGTEDAPVITGTATGAVVEDTTLTAGGTLSVTDADAADSPTFTAQAGTSSTYGTFSVTTGGVWSYALDNAAAQSLAGGESVTETFTVVATTADGESANQTVTVTITGTEDAPVITGTSSGTVVEDTTLTTGGTLVATDADATDTPTFTAQAGTPGTYGTFSVTTGGVWSYNLDNAAAQSLAGGQSVTETFTVAATTADGESASQVVTVTITGTEDAPVIDLDVDDSSGATGSGYQASFTEGGSAVALADVDIDISDVDSAQMNSATITLTNAQAGDQLDVSAVIGVGASVDTSVPGVITVTLTGPADPSVFESAIKAVTFENTSSNPATVDRAISVEVTDSAGASSSATTTVAVSQLPTLSVSDVSVAEPLLVLDGSALVSGEILSTGSDTTVDHWTFTHHGGALTIDAHETSGAIDPQIRLYELNPDGSLGTMLANNKDGGPGDDARITGTYSSGDYVVVIGDENLGDSEARSTSLYANNANDGGEYTLTFTGLVSISGNGDTAGYPANGGTVIDSGLSGTGTVDMTYTITLDQAPTVSSGPVTVNYEVIDGTANAGTDYTPPGTNPGVLTFAVGETSKTVTVTVNADAVIESNETVLLNLTSLSANANYDGSAHTIAGGIQGIGTILSADNPPEIINNSLTINEGDTVVLGSSDLSATDVDSNDADLLFMVTNVQYGEFQLVATGQPVISFTQQQIIDGEIQFVHDGSENAPSYDVTVSDGQLIDTGSPSISFTADVNDAPVANDDTYNVFENAAVGTHLGTVDASDPDVPAQTLSYSIVGGDPAGLFSIDAYGNITLAGALDYDTQTAHNLTIQVSDGSLTDNAVITVNVVDQDAPIAEDSDVSISEDSQAVFSSSDFAFTDQDGDAMASITITGLESVGSLRLWNGGSYVNVVVGDEITKAQLDNGDLVFDPVPDENGLPYDSFTFSVKDDTGNQGTTSATMSVNVTPVNDGPVSPVTDTDLTINLVGESALVGTPVGLTGFATDPDPEDTVSYQLVSNPNGYFAIDATTGQVTVASPLAIGSYDVVIRATSSDGTTSEETFTIQVVDAADDFATVHESALIDGSGRTETAFDDTDEAGQNVSEGQGTVIATGNLLANDPGATSVLSIDGNTPVSGVITVTHTYGQLVVDAATGNYTYTLTGAADNSAAADDQSVLDSFSYTTNIGTADLNVTIVDDVVQSNDVVTNVPEADVAPYQLVFTLDVSGSMTGSQWGGVVYLEDGTTTTRLEMAKDALKALATEYFTQSDSVKLFLSIFSTDATLLNGGNPYTDLQSALTAIDGMGGSGGTSYEDGLTSMIDMLDSNSNGVLDDTTSKTITYFISDGEPTSDNTTNPVGASGWDTFLANNSIDSYAVGIGAGISDYSHLNAIHNVDSDASGAIDDALSVTDVNSLETALLSTVPSSYGGSVVVNEGVSHVQFGADGGYIRSITVELDTDADNTPDTQVTFTYDSVADEITNDGGFATVSGEILTLDDPGYGFVYGSMIFSFENGSYSYFAGATVGEGDSFGFDFVAADSDGDFADPSHLTINIIDGKPVANNDVDTLFSNGTFLEGNVISGIGTDGGVALGETLTSIAPQGSGVDVAVDNAQITAVSYRGTMIDLTVDSSASGTGDDGTSFTYTVSGGVLALSNTSDGSELTFNSSGYYRYEPAVTPTSPTGAVITEVFTDGGTGQGVLLSSDDGTVTYQNTYGAGIDDGVEDWTDARDVDYGETMVIEFNSASYAHGVANVSLEFYGLTGTYEAFDISVYSTSGSLIGKYTVGDVATTHTENLPSEYSNIARIEIQGGSATEASIRQVSFQAVQVDTTTAQEPEVIGYTLTDSDGQSDTATLTLGTIHNIFAGTSADDTLSGTVSNDQITGEGGDDTLSGGLGGDILEGGAGDDSLSGGEGGDRLLGGEGIDSLFGDAGDDVLFGGLGDDTLEGGAGEDELSGGEGADTLRGGADADTLEGDAGDDTLEGGAGADLLYGGEGNDILTGGDGNDLILGNVGDDTLTGGAGSDTFIWKMNEQGTSVDPAVDVVTDFSTGVGGDVLDLSDLLIDEQNHPLTDYLHFEYDADNNQTIVQIDQDGGMFFRPSQEVVLEGVDLTGSGSLTDQQIIDTLLADGNLIIDV